MPIHRWSFLSHHGMVLVALTRRADLRLRDLALEVGISPRATQTIVSDLVEEGFLERVRVGRRNHYQVVGDRRLPDPWAADRAMGDLVGAIARRGHSRSAKDGRRRALVLACSDHRYQLALRELLSNIGLLSNAEVVLWPGGSTALTEPAGSLLLELIAAVDGPPPARIVRGAHERCQFWRPARSVIEDPLGAASTATRRRHRTVELVKEAFGIRPELWYLTERGARRMGRSDRQVAKRMAG
jgi:hypothetical protein